MSRRGKSGRFRGDLWFQAQVESRMRKTLKELQAQRRMPPGSLESLRGTDFYKKEFKRHAKLFKEERKLQAEQRGIQKRESSLKAQAEQEELLERDRAWAAEHEDDTDEELLDYLRQRADELGRTPGRREVLGSTYISRRFGSWAAALTIAELPLPSGMKLPKETTLNAYKKRAAAK